MSRFIELLAPARNLACGIEAIRHGADAVYIGADRFGARAAAGNSVEDITELCQFAHQFGARIYVTVNTILYDDELQATRDLIWALYEAGVDALIVQDLALLKMDLPPIPLHASTQMDNQTAEKAVWLARQGYEQVVLARELSLEQIRDIHGALAREAEETGRLAPALEAFVHGALCVSYSGRCYASQHCFGRSANRGECAQFCRLAFDLLDADGKVIEHDRHLLSLRDMNRSEHLEAMIDAGVSSFKIEGRLKDVSYVKNITAFYRQKLDAIITRRPDLSRSSFGRSTYTFKPDPSKSFNRGFTDYFLFGRTGREANFVTPKAMGEYIGRVKEVRRDAIVVGTPASLNNGDGFCFVDAEGHLKGFRTNRAEGNCIYTTVPGLIKGMAIYRNLDAAFERLLARPSAQRRIGVTMTLSDTPDGFELTLTKRSKVEGQGSKDEGQGLKGSRVQEVQGFKGSKVEGQSSKFKVQSSKFPYPHELARTPQADNIRKQLSRLGDTIFEATDIQLHLSDNWFIPSSVLADWRRQVCSLSLRSAELRAEATPSPVHLSSGPKPVREGSSIRGEIISNFVPFPNRGGAGGEAFTANASNHLARSVYEEAGATDIAPAYEILPPAKATIMTCRHCIRYAIGGCPQAAKQSSTLHPLPWRLRLADGRTFPLEFDCKRCEMRVKASDALI